MPKFLVRIETAANQATIYDTNKRRENAGASQLIHDIGVTWPKDALPVDGEVVIAVSGKAILLVNTEEDGKQVVRTVTKRGLIEAPGIDIRGAVVEYTDSFQQADSAARLKIEQLRAHVPGPETRFQRLPIVADCSTSGLPASPLSFRNLGAEVVKQDRSLISQSRLAAAVNARNRFRKLAPNGRELVGADYFEENSVLEWLAVIHADANNIGSTLGLFSSPGELRDFSRRLQQANEEAIRSAFRIVADLYNLDELPFLPLILGGDDFTVVCDGRYALPFVIEYLNAFEVQTRSLAAVLQKPCATSCAGVAFVKPHFPFHAAYRLSAELLNSAKRVKKQISPSVSAFDWHVLTDSVVTSLTDLRSHWKLGDGLATARPYVVTRDVKPIEGFQWYQAHAFVKLEELLHKFRKKDETDPTRTAVPRGVLHDLRAAVLQGRKSGELAFKIADNRTPEVARLELTTLFESDGTDHVTRWIDAMELDAFWPEALPR